MENAQERHKRFQSQEGEIVNYANAFGILAAMDRYDVRSGFTIQKMMERRGDGKKPLVDNKAMFESGESYYESIVKGIVATISKLETTITQRDTRIAELRQEIDKLQDEKRSFGSLGRQKEETVMEELLEKIK